MNRQSYINGYKKPKYIESTFIPQLNIDEIMPFFQSLEPRDLDGIVCDYVPYINNPIRQESPAAMIRRIANESLREIGAPPINNESIPAGKLLQAFNLQERTQFFLNQGLDPSQIDVANSSYLRNNPTGRNQHE